jgi:hypothetical protein
MLINSCNEVCINRARTSGGPPFALNRRIKNIAAQAVGPGAREHKGRFSLFYPVYPAFARLFRFCGKILKSAYSLTMAVVNSPGFLRLRPYSGE